MKTFQQWLAEPREFGAIPLVRWGDQHSQIAEAYATSVLEDPSERRKIACEQLARRLEGLTTQERATLLEVLLVPWGYPEPTPTYYAVITPSRFTSEPKPELHITSHPDISGIINGGLRKVRAEDCTRLTLPPGQTHASLNALAERFMDSGWWVCWCDSGDSYPEPK